MIIPKQFLKTIKRTGLGTALFSELRYNDDGSENPDFVLNKPAYRKRQDPGRRRQFRLRLSREHAPWALLDFGIRCVISTASPTFSTTTASRTACCRSWSSRPICDKLLDDAERGSNATVTIDLPKPENPRPGRRHGQVRDRPVPQALPDQRPRRHRADAGKEGLDRQLRGQGQDRARLGVGFRASRSSYSVMRGLDPRIHLLTEMMDRRVKPGDDLPMDGDHRQPTRHFIIAPPPRSHPQSRWSSWRSRRAAVPPFGRRAGSRRARGFPAWRRRQ